jgi:hypothetical protein
VVVFVLRRQGSQVKISVFARDLVAIFAAIFAHVNRALKDQLKKETLSHPVDGRHDTLHNDT